jgi:hypothetical protein
MGNNLRIGRGCSDVAREGQLLFERLKYHFKILSKTYFSQNLIATFGTLIEM